MRPIAILVSDLHLSIKQPACRADDDWLDVQKEYLGQIRNYQHPGGKHANDHLPVICAGDIFDKWNPPPELIHFALEFLPDKMICVPGQHDLPNHSFEEIHRCGYGVLVKAGKIEDISDHALLKDGFIAVGFPWGRELRGWEDKSWGHNFEHIVKVAVIHQYCWIEGCSYPGAPEDSNAKKVRNALKGFNVAVFGDNHAGFTSLASGQTSIYNCGGFIRRKSDEMKYKPCIGVLYSDGRIERIKLFTKHDKFHDPKTVREEMPFDMKALIDELKGLGEHGLNFKDEVLRHLDREKVDAETRKAVLEALEE